MKKILSIIISLGIFLIPNMAFAKTYNFSGYYCDNKEAIDDETFSMTCHIVATTDFEVNHIMGSLILKNVELSSIKTSSDWKSNNGTSINVDFTSTKTHSGSFNVADLIFTGKLSDTNCEASFMPDLVEKITEKVYVCAIIDNEYYGKKGIVVDEVTYYEECCDYACTVVDNKYYFDSNGKSVTYEQMLNDCSEEQTITETITETTVSPQTGLNYGYIILPLGIVSIMAIVKFTHKKSKIYKI